MVSIILQFMYLNGRVAANGMDGKNTNRSGGGSGGSVQLKVDILLGYGSISVFGGIAYRVYSSNTYYGKKYK